MECIIDILSRYKRPLAILVLLSLIVPACFIRELRIDNSIEVWLQRDSVEYQRYQAFLESFGTEEFVVIALETTDPLSDESLELQRKIAAKLRDIDGVDRVLDIPSISDAIWGQADGWKIFANQSKFLENSLIGKDGRTSGLIAMLKPSTDSLSRRQVVESIEQTAFASQTDFAKIHLAGTPLMNVVLDRASVRSAKTFLPIALVVSLIVMAWMFKSAAGVIAPMCAVGSAVVWTMGLMAMCGRTLNMVTIVLPSLLFVLALSNGIHLASRYAASFSESVDADKAAKGTLRELIRPALISSITTAIGFGSLALAGMEPVRDLGIFAAIGMIIAVVCNLCIVPGLMSVFHRQPSKAIFPSNTNNPSRLATLGVTFARRPRGVVILATLIMVLSIGSFAKLKTESNILKFFPKSSRIARDYEFIGNNLTGFYTVEMEMQTSLENEFELTAAVTQLGLDITARPEVARVNHLGQFEEFAQYESTNVPASNLSGMMELVGRLKNGFRKQKGEQVSLRLSILVRAMSSNDFDALITFIEKRASDVLPESTTWNTTGIVSLIDQSQHELIKTQIKSFAIAAPVVIIMIGLLFTSIRAALASIIPNLLPVVGMFAIMAMLEIALDPATVMIASVAIGIAVDDTVHFLSRYKEELCSGLPPLEATAETFRKIGPAMVATSLVAAAGFIVLCLAQFRPIIYFGFLTAFTIIAALGADILMLPSCAYVLNLWEKNKSNYT
jgi:predicted RND superfamily exporter protein